MSGTVGLDHPIGGPPRSGHPVDAPVPRGIGSPRFIFYYKILDNEIVTITKLKEQYKTNSQTFFRDVYNLNKLKLSTYKMLRDKRQAYNKRQDKVTIL